MQQLMKQAQKMQQQMATAQAELAAAEVTGTAGGELVSVTMTGRPHPPARTRPGDLIRLWPAPAG